MIVEKKNRVENGEDIAVLYIEGVIQLGKSAYFFQNALENVLARRRVVIDMLKVDYIDSTGIGELIAVCARFAEPGRKLPLINVTERVLKLLDIAKLSDRFEIFIDEDEAVASLVATPAARRSPEQSSMESLPLPLPAPQAAPSMPVQGNELGSTSANARRLSVFVCHASDDKDKVRIICHQLSTCGADVWFDEEKLEAGQDWRYEISRALRRVDAVIVCLSALALTKPGYIQKEIREALEIADEQPEGSNFLIPAKLEPCDVPRRLARWQWVDLNRVDGVRRLVRGLNARALHVGAALLGRPGS